jgi:Fe-S-cluster containining protein
MANPENACASLGCPAACCRNITLELSSTEADRFLDGLSVTQFNPATVNGMNLDEVAALKKGVYVIDDEHQRQGTVFVYIKGACPYLNTTTMDCTIFEQKKRPGICSEVPIGHSTCTSQRVRMGLRPVSG